MLGIVSRDSLPKQLRVDSLLPSTSGLRSARCAPAYYVDHWLRDLICRVRQRKLRLPLVRRSIQELDRRVRSITTRQVKRRVPIQHRTAKHYHLPIVVRIAVMPPPPRVRRERALVVARVVYFYPLERRHRQHVHVFQRVVVAFAPAAVDGQLKAAVVWCGAQRGAEFRARAWDIVRASFCFYY